MILTLALVMAQLHVEPSSPTPWTFRTRAESEAPTWAWDLERGWIVSPVLVPDLDGDGRPEVAYSVEERDSWHGTSRKSGSILVRAQDGELLAKLDGPDSFRSMDGGGWLLWRGQHAERRLELAADPVWRIHRPAEGQKTVWAGGFFQAVRDCTADGVSDLIFRRQRPGAPDTLELISGADGCSVWSISDEATFRFDMRQDAVGDWNQDGYGDLVVVGRTPGSRSCLQVRSGRDGSVLDSLPLPDIEAWSDWFEVGDLDGDGRFELVIVGQAPLQDSGPIDVHELGVYQSRPTLHLVHWSGASHWQELSAGRTLHWLQAAGDLDGDGLDDLLVGLETPDGSRTIEAFGDRGFALVRAAGAEEDEWNHIERALILPLGTASSVAAGHGAFDLLLVHGDKGHWGDQVTRIPGRR